MRTSAIAISGRAWQAFLAIFAAAALVAIMLLLPQSSRPIVEVEGDGRPLFKEEVIILITSYVSVFVGLFFVAIGLIILVGWVVLAYRRRLRSELKKI
jgi:cyanate permease